MISTISRAQLLHATLPLGPRGTLCKSTLESENGDQILPASFNSCMTLDELHSKLFPHSQEGYWKDSVKRGL